MTREIGIERFLDALPEEDLEALVSHRRAGTLLPSTDPALKRDDRL